MFAVNVVALGGLGVNNSGALEKFARSGCNSIYSRRHTPMCLHAPKLTMESPTTIGLTSAEAARQLQVWGKNEM